MDITSLEIESHANGGSKVTAWCKCTSPDEIDDLVAWLALAQHVMVTWHGIRAGKAVDTANVTPIKKGKEP